MPNRPTRATGTIQRSIFPSEKPLSRSVLSSAGIIGSVSAPTMVQITASTMPADAERKYGQNLTSRSRMVAVGSAAGVEGEVKTAVGGS
jgi:hypothetical protein